MERGLIAKRLRGTLWGDGNVLYLNYGLGYLYIYICQNSLNFTLQKADFIFFGKWVFKVLREDSSRFVGQNEHKAAAEIMMSG